MTYSSRLKANLALRGEPGFGVTKPPGWVFDRIAQEKESGADKTGSREQSGKPWKSKVCPECFIQMPVNGCEEHGQSRTRDQRRVGRTGDQWL